MAHLTNVPRRRADARILHLTHDNVFIARFSRLIDEVAPGRSSYIILASGGALAHPVLGAVTITRTVAESRRAVLDAIADFDVLIVHYMFASWARIVTEVAPRITVVWSGYGGDYYGSTHDPYADQLGPRTAALRAEIAPTVRPHARIMRWWQRRRSADALARAAAAADGFSAPVRADLEVFTARFPGFEGRYLQLSYSTAEVAAPARSRPSGENVLVGNSASLTNNHLEVFDWLSRLRTEGRTVVVPLSYGEPPAYRDAVIGAGRRLFGSDFAPVLEHLPLHDYQEMLSGCAFVLMGHRRQQGLGNVLSALLGGSAVVLDADNPVHRQLTQAGARFGRLYDPAARSLDDLAVSEAQCARNHEVVRRLRGRDRVLEDLRAALEVLGSPR